MEINDFFKELYQYEMNRKDEVHRSLQAPISNLILAFGALFYLAYNFNWRNIAIAWIFFSLFLIAILFACTSLFYITVAIWTRSYLHLPLPLELQDYYGKLKDHFGKYKQDESDTDLIFVANISKQHVDIAHIACQHSDRKVVLRGMATRFLALAAWTIFIMALIFIYSIKAYS